MLDWESCVVVDLFAGSGAMGIEALSRGAVSATFVDDNPKAIAVIEKNVAAFGISEARIIKTDATRFETPTADDHHLVVFADPPYAFDRWEPLLRQWQHATLFIAESDREISPGPQQDLVKSRRYGGSFITLMQPISANPG